MNIEAGDVLVFVGNKKGQPLDEHFRNFTIGKRYEVSSVMLVQYDIDEVTSVGGNCIIFKGETYGCNVESVDEYFVRQEEWRDGLLSKILPKSLMKLIKR